MSISEDPVSRRTFLRRGTAAGAYLTASGALLAACGDDSSSGSSAAKGDAAGLTGSLTYIKGPADPRDLTWQRDFAGQFVRKHPQTAVTPKLYDWATMDTQLTTAYAGPNPPDVAYLITAVWRKFADVGALADLTQYVRDPSYKSEYDAVPQALWDAITHDGKVYGVPLLGATFPMYANLDLLKKAGVTDWNESYDKMRAAAQATRRGDTYGFAMRTTWADQAWIDLSTYVHDSGGELFNEDQTQGGLDTPGVAAAFDLLRAMHFEDGSAPRPGLYDAEAVEALFKAGRIAIMHGNTAVVGDLEAKSPGFDWDVFMPPPGPMGQSIEGDFGFLCVAAKSESKDLAWEYIKHLSSAAIEADFVKRMNKILQPARTDINDRIFGSEQSPQRRVQQEFAPRVRSWPAHPQQLDALRPLTSEFELCIRGKKSGAQAVEDANAAVNDIVA